MALGFITQGSESFASWQANLLFEPILFEVILVLSIFRYNFNLFSVFQELGLSLVWLIEN